MGDRSVKKAFFALGVATGVAASLMTPSAMAEDPALYKFGIGAFDVNKRDDTAVEFRAEYQGKAFWEQLKPIAGLSVTTDGGAYAFAGLAYDFQIGENFYVTPSIAPGLYAKGSGKDLGHVLEFRSQLEAGYKMGDDSRLGVAISHRSNASIGDKNPGEESATLYYSVSAASLRNILD